MEFLAKILRCIRFTRSICLSRVMRLINIMMRIQDEIYLGNVLEYVDLHLVNFIVSGKFWWFERIWCSLNCGNYFIKLRFVIMILICWIQQNSLEFNLFSKIKLFSWNLFIQLIQRVKIYSAEIWLFKRIQLIQQVKFNSAELCLYTRIQLIQ